jgi:hypothetical protein
MSERRPPAGALNEMMASAARVLPLVRHHATPIGPRHQNASRGVAALARAKAKGPYISPWRASLRKRPSK